LRLAGVSVCNRTAADQPDVELEIRLGGGIRTGRTGVDVMETATKLVKGSKTIERTSALNLHCYCVHSCIGIKAESPAVLNIDSSVYTVQSQSSYVQ
jgi:hypothetical protein